jgi:hypothetical protein
MKTLKVKILVPTCCGEGIACPGDVVILPELSARRLIAIGAVSEVRPPAKAGLKLPRQSHAGKKYLEDGAGIPSASIRLKRRR